MSVKYEHLPIGYNKGYESLAGELLCRAPSSRDYLVQCPALLPMAFFGSSRKAGWKNSHKFEYMWVHRTSKAPKLRQLMEWHDIAYPWRALLAASLPHVADLQKTANSLRLVSRWVNSSTIAQGLKTNKAGQKRLLRAIGWTIDRNSVATQRPFSPYLSWIVQRAAILPDDGVASQMGDMYLRGGPFDFRWSAEDALSALDRWHDELVDGSRERESLEALGIAWNMPLWDQGYPIEMEVNAHQFTALRTPRELYIEGRNMNHCVLSYARAVKAGISRIYSVSSQGKRVATLEIDPMFQIVQLKGRFNAAVSKKTQAVCQAFCKSAKEQS